MEVWQLHTFCVLAEELNFTRTAERVHTVQSKVNSQIRADTATADTDRGRDAYRYAPPAQSRTCGFPAYGFHLGYLTAKR
jgi:hypothetical protein